MIVRGQPILNSGKTFLKSLKGEIIAAESFSKKTFHASCPR